MRMPKLTCKPIWAVPWITGPPVCKAGHLSPGSSVVEIGYGTGNHIIALSQRVAKLCYIAFDVTPEMLAALRFSYFQNQLLSAGWISADQTFNCEKDSDFTLFKIRDE